MSRSSTKILFMSLVLISTIPSTPLKAGAGPDMLDGLGAAAGALCVWGISQAVCIGWYIKVPKNKKNTCIAASPTLAVLTLVAAGKIIEEIK